MVQLSSRIEVSGSVALVLMKNVRLDFVHRFVVDLRHGILLHGMVSGGEIALLVTTCYNTILSITMAFRSRTEKVKNAEINSAK